MIDAEAMRGRAFVQGVGQPPQPGVVEPTPATGRPFRGQGLHAAGRPLLPSVVDRGPRRVLYHPSIQSKIAARAVARVGHGRRWSSSVLMVAKNDSATALSQH
nr:hypothetical protein [Micromonospora sp. KC207]